MANRKLERALESLNIIDQQTEMKLLLRSGVLYNRVSSKNSEQPNLPEIREFGGIKRYEGYPPMPLVAELAKLPVFNNLT